MLADAHCHLDLFKEPKKALKNALDAGVESVFSCSTNLESMKKHLGVFSGQKRLKIALGVHPADLLFLPESQLDEALSFLEKNVSKAHAVGEIGLDFKYAKTKEQKKLQEDVFVRQLSLALKNKLPVVVHARFAEKKAMELLLGLASRKVLMHWFTNSFESVKMASDCGFFMSAGPIVFSSPEAALVASKIPLDLLLVETDAPVAFEGKQSEPSWIPRVGQKLAQDRGVSFTQLAEKTGQNYALFFDGKN